MALQIICSRLLTLCIQLELEAIRTNYTCILVLLMSVRCAPPSGTGDNDSSSLGIRFVATGMLFWLSYRPQHSHHVGWCTQLLDLYVAFHQEITWHQHSDLSIGCQLSRGLKAWIQALPACPIRPSMDEHPSTSRTWLKRRRRYLAELQTALPATMTMSPGGRDWSSEARQMCLLRRCTTHLESAANRN